MLHDTKSHSLAGSSPSSAGSRPPRPGDLQDRARSRRSRGRGRPRRGRRGALQGHPGHQDHGTAVELHLAHRREGDPRPVQADQGRLLHREARPPAVYRGNPFIIEAGSPSARGRTSRRWRPAVPLAEGEQAKDDDELARVIRYANRVPLLYQQSACATFKAALETAWRTTASRQSRGALPAGPMVIFVHMASVWVPFTSESKEAIADYDEIRKEIKLALQECGRRLGVFLRRRAGQERVPPAQHLRAVHRGGRRGLRPPQGRQAGQGQAQGPAAEDRRPADRRRPDRRDPGPRRRRPGGPAALDHRHARGPGRGGAGARRRPRAEPPRPSPLGRGGRAEAGATEGQRRTGPPARRSGAGPRSRSARRNGRQWPRPRRKRSGRSRKARRRGRRRHHGRRA